MTARSSDTVGTVRVVKLIAGRELGQRLRTKSFYILTAILVLLILAIGVLNRVVGDDGPGRIDVGVTAPIPTGLNDAVDQVSGAFDREATVQPVADAAAARAALDDGDLDVIVMQAERQLLFGDEVDDEVQAILQQAWAVTQTHAALVDSGLTPAEVDAVLSPAPLDVRSVDGGSDSTGLAILTGSLTAVLLFISLQTFGNYVLVGVVEEKSTAVVELLLARVRSDQLLAGKIIGIGVAALLQFAAAVAAGLIALAVSGASVPGEIWSALPMTLVWFLGGYALYSTLFALAGSLVSRQEDAQAASAPILTAMIAAYMVVFIFGYVPESTASTILSLLPPIAPFLMPMRMAAGAASVLEVAVALVLLVGATVAAWKLAGRIYEQVLLQRGSRISWGAAMALLRRS